MPVYTYKCPNRICTNSNEERTFDTVRSITETELSIATCPFCKSDAERIILSTGVTFRGKGAGWVGKIKKGG